MKLVIFVLSILAVLYCASSDRNTKAHRKHDDNDDQELEGRDNPTAEYSTPDVGATPQSLPTTPASATRMRRSPPRFDPNKMKGKASKLSREKRDIDVGKIFRRVQDYMGGQGRKKRSLPEEIVPSVFELLSGAAD